MDMPKSKRLLLMLFAMYWILIVMIYIIAHEQFRYQVVTSDTPSKSAAFGELVDGQVVTQRLIAPAEELVSIDVMATTYNRENTGLLKMNIVNSEGQVLLTQKTNVSSFEEGVYTTINFDRSIQVRTGEKLNIVFTTEGCVAGNAISIYFGNTVTVGRFDIAQEIAPEDLYVWNYNTGVGKLCVRINGIKELVFYKTYWLFAGGIFAILGGYALWGYHMAKKGKNNGIVAICTLYCKYRFLLIQLVARDFKTKYKRSVLGMAWSFLNPLLTMAVQYVVFSTLFKSSTPNYPVYLLSGIVFFNFFNEAITMGMTSITGNASLIKKVYIPKYIYPFSKLFSSLINFGLALIPLLLVMLITNTKICLSILLIIFDIACLLGFVMGMILTFSTAMVFFQDTQFLWGVISLMWMYLTPVFYPENIIPEKLLTLYHMNPMYQYITFARICIIDGVSPEPMAYLWCLVSSIIVLMFGIFVFKRYQDQFVLHL